MAGSAGRGGNRELPLLSDLYIKLFSFLFCCSAKPMLLRCCPSWASQPYFSFLLHFPFGFSPPPSSLPIHTHTHFSDTEKWMKIGVATEPKEPPWPPWPP